MPSIAGPVRRAAIGVLVAALAACVAPASPATRTISGRITGIGQGIDAGTPTFSGVLLRAFADDESWEAVIAPDGTYAITVPPGSYRLSALVHGSAAFDEFWSTGQTMSVDESAATLVSAVDTDAIADLAFPALALVRVTLAADPSGAPRTEDELEVWTALRESTSIALVAGASTFYVPAGPVYSICAYHSADVAQGGTSAACSVVKVEGNGADVVIGRVVGGSTAAP